MEELAKEALAAAVGEKEAAELIIEQEVETAAREAAAAEAMAQAIEGVE